jgi:glycosyltransferase involved in cell wall biosynthesis
MPVHGLVVLATSKKTFHPRHFHLLARGLKAAGVPVIVIGQPMAGDEPRDIDVRFLPLRTGRLRRMLSGPDVLRRALKLKPSLIQINSLELLPWAVLVRKVFRTPMIYDCNEDYAGYMLQKQWLPRPLRKPLSRLVAFLEPRLAAQLDATVFADTLTPERFSDRVPRLLVVHNFPWRALAEEADLAMSSSWPFDVTYHGSLPTYHAEAIIETARILKDRGHRLSWCIAAREYEMDEQSWLRNQVVSAALEEEFTLLFNIPYAQISTVLADTRFGLIPLPDTPKFRRNIPRKVFEFMAVGRPAVVSDLPPTRAVIGDAGCCVLVAPGDPSAYADGLELLLADDERANEMGRRGRQLILERLNAEHELEPYLDLCRELAER